MARIITTLDCHADSIIVVGVSVEVAACLCSAGVLIDLSRFKPALIVVAEMNDGYKKNRLINAKNTLPLSF